MTLGGLTNARNCSTWTLADSFHPALLCEDDAEENGDSAQAAPSGCEAGIYLCQRGLARRLDLVAMFPLTSRQQQALKAAAQSPTQWITYSQRPKSCS